MKKARVFVNQIEAGVLQQLDNNKYIFQYHENYQGQPVSLTMPTKQLTYEFKHFPPFFEGLLPEGVMLEALLRKYKIDKNDLFTQLLKVGHDVVGAVTIEEIK